MDAGKYDQRIAIDREDRVSDGGGGSSVTWTEVAKVWAAVWPVGAREQVVADQLHGASLYRVRIRNAPSGAPAVETSYRLRWLTNGGIVLNVRGGLDGGRRQAHRELICEAGVAS
jgi:head-tail adaptor